MDLVGYTAYALVKWAAYSTWCFLGLRILALQQSPSIRRAALLGVGRLTLGVVVGLFIFVAALSMNNATRNAPLTYLSIYVPVRVVEWSVFHIVISRGVRWPRSVAWVLGGVAISCLADIPVGIMEHGVVPVGRPFC